MKNIIISLIIAPLLLGALFILMTDNSESAAKTLTGPLDAPSMSTAAASSFGSGTTVGNAYAQVEALVAGDLDNDGDPDLVSADGKIIAWENDGSPFSGLWNNHAAGSPGVAIYALALGDLDHDGDLDLASGAEWSGGPELQVWQNDGTPFDALWTSNGVGSTDAVLVLAAGDLDDDGDLDLVSGDDDAVVMAWQNDGSPFDGAWIKQHLGGASSDVTALALGDLDDDGDLDVVAGNTNNRVRAWQNDGDPFGGAWSAHDVFTTTDGVESLVLADVDGDGDLDLLAGLEAGETYELTSWQNDGTPFSGAWTRHDVGEKDLGTIYALAAADLDVDGDLDLASGAQTRAKNAEVRAWENNGSPFAGLWSGSDVAQAGADVRALTSADLDNDGDPDLIAATSVITAWPNTRAPGVWSQWTQSTHPLPTHDALSVALADFDHDGALDLAAGTGGTGHGVHVWRGDGGYSWTYAGGGPLPTDGVWNGVAWGQINNADELDLAAASQGDGLRAWVASQGGAVWSDVSTGLPASGDYADLALTHVDHDGQLDLVACGKSLGVGFWTWTGSGWGARGVLSNTVDFCDLALGHVDRDGGLDVAAAGCGGQGLRVWLGDGHFGFGAAKPVAASGDYEAVALGDLNHDGHADVVAAPVGSGGALVWLGDGGTSWTYQGAIAPPLDVLSLDLADFDNDGYLDVLAGLGADGVRVWRGDGGASWTPASTGLATTQDYYGVAFGRVDADAALDVVGAESGASGVRVWTAVEPPPGGWMNLQPETNPPYVWARGQQLTCTVQVVDVGSGLDVSSAQYRFSRDGGFSWVGGWLTATVSGADGSTALQTITATAVPFNQDAETRNAVQFRIADMAGLTGTSPVYYVAVDTTPPTNPADLNSPDHTQGAWSDDQSVRFTWTDEGSDNLSGVWGYSWVFNRVADERPDETVEQGAGPGDLIDLWGIPDGDWYFHFMTRDRAGNWAAPVHLGPYRIDTAPPSEPTLDISSHAVGGWSDDDTIWIHWEATDGGGVAGYSYVWHQNADYYVDPIIDTTGDTANSDPLADGQWYLHVRAVDAAGNAGPTAHWGPFGVDATDPSSCWLNVPRYSNSETCLVEWTALDATSGVANYDVQVRDDNSFTPTWEDWLVGTVASTAVYTDADHGAYSFRVRARDEAGNVSGYDCEDQTVVEDLNAQDIEVTQGIQNLDNDAPLIAGKTAYVRFYVRTSWNDVSRVDARLHGTRGGSALPGSPLRPTGGHITVRAGGGDRDNLDDAFYFRLPPAWRSGTVELRAVVDPDDEVPEDEFHDNESTETVTFESSGDFCIVFVPVHLHPSTYYVGDAGFWDMVELTKWMYPVRNGGIDTYSVGTMYPDAHPHWHYGIPDDFDRILGDLAGVDFWTSDPCDDTHYYGMVHPDSYPGWGATGMGERYNTVVGDDAAGIMAISLEDAWPQPTGGRTMAHELGHNFRRKHVECTGGESDGGEVDGTYPYPDRPPCRIGPDDPSAYYGFWPQPGGPTEIITPTEAADLMSYGLRRWPSDWTYRALLGELRDLVRAQTQNNLLALSPAWAQADEYLFAAGLISPAGQTAELWAFYRTSEPDPGFVAHSFQQELATATSDDTYSLVLEDALGQVLYTHTFSATALTDVGPSPGTATFAEVFPYDDRTARIVLKYGATELASRTVSAHAPTVTLLSPNGGETISDQWTLSWSGSDPDGDDVRYSVQYSPDEGATWQSLAVDWMSTSLKVESRDLSILPGSEQALVRVTATDGVNTAQDQSDATFSLARKTPQAHIIEPKTGAQYAHGSTVVLRGSAIDAEDGPLDETGTLTWTSNLSGTLGGGGELWVSGLSTGTHRITLAVADSDGDTGTDEVVIFVGLSPQKIYLPVVLKH